MRGTWQTTSGGGGRGLVLVLAVIAGVVLIGSGTATAAASAITNLLVTIAVIIGSLVGLAIAAGIGWLVWRARQDRPGRPIATPLVSQLPPGSRPRLEEPSKPAIEPARAVHIHFHGTDPAEVAAIIRRIDTGED